MIKTDVNRGMLKVSPGPKEMREEEARSKDDFYHPQKGNTDANSYKIKIVPKPKSVKTRLPQLYQSNNYVAAHCTSLPFQLSL